MGERTTRRSRKYNTPLRPGWCVRRKKRSASSGSNGGRWSHTSMNAPLSRGNPWRISCHIGIHCSRACIVGGLFFSFGWLWGEFVCFFYHLNPNKEGVL